MSISTKGLIFPPETSLVDTDKHGRITNGLNYLWSRWFQDIVFRVPLVNTYSQELAPTAVGANTTSVQTFTVNGLVTGDIVSVAMPSGLRTTIGLGIAGVSVSADNTLAVKYMNVTGGSLTPPTETYTFFSVRR